MSGIENKPYLIHSPNNPQIYILTSYLGKFSRSIFFQAKCAKLKNMKWKKKISSTNKVSLIINKPSSIEGGEVEIFLPSRQLYSIPASFLHFFISYFFRKKGLNSLKKNFSSVPIIRNSDYPDLKNRFSLAGLRINRISSEYVHTYHICVC